MDKYLNAPIKQTITEHPAVGRILEEFKIGCVPCTLGSCLLKDIVAIHNLSKAQEIDLLYRIEKALYPERHVVKPSVPAAAAQTQPRALTYSPPLRRLVDEHTVIKRVVTRLPALVERVDPRTPAGRQLVADGLEFIRSYADRYHHAKEEDILFLYVNRELDIVQTILQDHVTGRGHVQAALAALTAGDAAAVGASLMAYHTLLTEHIKKEDEILYPWIDRGLTTSQVGELYARFDAADSQANKEVIARCVRLAEEIERRIQQAERKT